MTRMRGSSSDASELQAWSDRWLVGGWKLPGAWLARRVVTVTRAFSSEAGEAPSGKWQANDSVSLAYGSKMAALKAG